MQLDRAWRLLWIAPLIGALAIAVSCLQLPFAGGFHDDGVYLVSAKALAEGRGYVIESLPDEIPQTKYPILFPAILSAAWRLSPSFPDNVAFLRLVPLLASAGWAWIVWRLIGVAWKRSGDVRWLLPMAMTAPLILYLTMMPLSETLFAFLGACSILTLWKASQETEGTGLRHAMLAAVVCAAAFHTRTIGISLLACAAIAFPPWRRLKQGAVFGLVWIALCAPWWIWQRVHAAPEEPVLAYYTKANYADWNGISGSGAPPLLDMVKRNAIIIAGSGLTIWGLPVNAGTTAVSLLAAMAVAVGLAVQLFRRESMGAAWVLATVALALVWPWPPQRFLVPVLPFALLAMFDALPGELRGRFQLPGKILAICVIGFGLFVSARYAIDSREAGVLRGPLNPADLTWEDHRETYDWVEARTPLKTVLAGNFDPNYWLYTGRKGVRAFAADPGRLFYAPDSPDAALGSPDDLAGLLRKMGVGYLILERSRLFSETEVLDRQIQELRARRPLFLPLAFESSSRRISVYRVDWAGFGK